MSIMTASLADAIFWVAVALCTAAQAALLHSFFRGASRPRRDAAASFRATETVWAVLPALVLVALFTATWQARHATPVPQWQAMAPAAGAPAAPQGGGQP